ncbi:hypothetical protein GGR55DRAFT_107993 [Xylaria sp. FL0064]|nr:hypothetical protein GGR55DRAFT_107993 [Xylaria sp. FL0064]
MNWTEGSLARHSRGRQRNALITRQKQHFAKARSGLLNARPKPGPVSISFLSSESTSESPWMVSVSRNHDDRLSTSPSLSNNREPQRESLSYTRRNDDREDLMTDFDRRRRLLEKPDWAGLRLQEPLDISFPGQIYATKRWTRAASPRETVLREPRRHATPNEEELYKRRERQSMRIQIGSQVIQPSIETGSQPSTSRHTLNTEPSAHVSHHKLKSRTKTQCSEGGTDRHRAAASNDNFRASPTFLGDHEAPFNVVCSAPVIHEPAPRRIFTSQTQQWLSSSADNRQSMEVEIERPIRLVPSSQESEQQRWKDWVVCEESSNLMSNSPFTTVATSEIQTRDSESSVITLPSHLQPRLPSLHLSSERDLTPRCSLPERSLKHISPEKASRSHDRPQVDRCLLGNNSPLLPNQHCIPPKKPAIPDDLNDIWRQFACGDDEDSEQLLEDAFKEAALRAAVELRPSNTSESADEYVETAATCGTELTPSVHLHKSDDMSLEPSSESAMATKGTTGSETVLSTMATVGSPDEPLSNPTSFTVPKAFIGKYANVDYSSIPARAFNADVSRGDKKGKRKRRKMATDGRTDIRGLPDFDGDPIEEFEEV